MKLGDRVEMPMPVNYPVGDRRIESRTGEVVAIWRMDGMADVKVDGHEDAPILRHFIDRLTRIVEGK